MKKYEREMLQRRLDNEKDMIKDLKLVYKQASEDCAAKIAALSARTDMENLQSIVYQKQYQAALKKQIDGILELLQANEFERIADYLGLCYEDGFLESLYSLNKQGIPLVFPIDQSQVVQAVQTDSKISTGLYTRMGEDIKELKTNIRAEISRGIANGSSYNEIAKQIAMGMNSPFKKAFNSAVRISRTEGNRIANQAAMDACYKARDKGADIAKQWDSTLDGKTRPSHRQADGEIRELDEKFSNGLMRPGDPAGGASEVVNCRCALLQRARWVLEGGLTKMNNFTKEIEVFDSAQAYEDFKKNFFSEENVKYMNYVDTLEKRYQTKDFKKILESMTDGEYQHYAALLKNNPIYKEQEKITKSMRYAVDGKMLESRKYSDKFNGITNDKATKREILNNAKEMLHHRSGQDGEDLYLYNISTKVWTKSLSGTEAGKPEYTEEIKNAIKTAEKGELIAFHNHPASMPPSSGDINAALQNGYAKGYTLCHNGKVFEYTASDRFIDDSIYELRIAYYQKKGYNEYDSQMEALKYFSGSYGFTFREVE